jgi:hypothetical protein
MQFYTYAHYKPNGDIFYIGKGQGMRYKSFASGRSKHWHEAAKEGFESVILARWPSEDEALDHETLLISCFEGKLVNRTTGGQRGKHAPITEETRAKMVSAQRKINERRLTDPVWDKKISAARSRATKNRKEGYQSLAGIAFKEKMSTDVEFAKRISKNRAMAQSKSAESMRIASAEKAQKILAFRLQGKSYKEIMMLVGCSIGFVSKVVNNA